MSESTPEFDIRELDRKVAVKKDYWEDSGIKKPLQVVVCAACKYGSLILCGARHWDGVMRKQLEVINKRGESGDFKHLKGMHFTEGFIDQFGGFLTRKEAWDLTGETRQLVNLSRNGSDVELYSEGLY